MDAQHTAALKLVCLRPPQGMACNANLFKTRFHFCYVWAFHSDLPCHLCKLVIVETQVWIEYFIDFSGNWARRCFLNISAFSERIEILRNLKARWRPRATVLAFHSKLHKRRKVERTFAILKFLGRSNISEMILVLYSLLFRRPSKKNFFQNLFFNCATFYVNESIDTCLILHFMGFGPVLMAVQERTFTRTRTTPEMKRAKISVLEEELSPVSAKNVLQEQDFLYVANCLYFCIGSSQEFLKAKTH